MDRAIHKSIVVSGPRDARLALNALFLGAPALAGIYIARQASQIY